MLQPQTLLERANHVPLGQEIPAVVGIFGESIDARHGLHGLQVCARRVACAFCHGLGKLGALGIAGRFDRLPDGLYVGRYGLGLQVRHQIRNGCIDLGHRLADRQRIVLNRQVQRPDLAVESFDIACSLNGRLPVVIRQGRNVSQQLLRREQIIQQEAVHPTDPLVNLAAGLETPDDGFSAPASDLALVLAHVTRGVVGAAQHMMVQPGIEDELDLQRWLRGAFPLVRHPSVMVQEDLQRAAEFPVLERQPGRVALVEPAVPGRRGNADGREAGSGYLQSDEDRLDVHRGPFAAFSRTVTDASFQHKIQHGCVVVDLHVEVIRLFARLHEPGRDESVPPAVGFAGRKLLVERFVQAIGYLSRGG